MRKSDQVNIFEEATNNRMPKVSHMTDFNENYSIPCKRKALVEIQMAIKKFRLEGTIDC